MKLSPATLNSSKQINVYERAKAMMSRIDKYAEATRGAEGTSQDLNPLPDRVAVSNFVVERLPAFSDMPMDVGSHILRVLSGTANSSGSFAAAATIPGFWGMMPMDLPAHISRHESETTIVYEQKMESSVPGPGRTRVELDKASGELDIRQYSMNFFRVPVSGKQR